MHTFEMTVLPQEPGVQHMHEMSNQNRCHLEFSWVKTWPKSQSLAFLDLLVMWQPFKTKPEQWEFQKNVVGISKNTITFDDNLIVGTSLVLPKPRTVRQIQRFFWEAARHQPKVSQSEKGKWNKHSGFNFTCLYAQRKLSSVPEHEATSSKSTSIPL